MIGNDNIKTWEDFKALEQDEQIKTINDLLEQGHTVPQIMDSIGANRTTLGSHFKKLGYKRIGNKFELIGAEIEPIEPNKEVNPVAKPKQNKMKALEVYTDVHNTLVNIDTDNYVRTSISLAKSTNAKLDEFLKGLKLLNKQDVITVALEEFMAKYSKG